MENGQDTPLTRNPFAFTGKTGEYFRIWIVNIFLTVLTLGIYSAWAKVRNMRYFYGNTKVDNTAFDYLADPVVILGGRLVAFGIFIIYLAFTRAFPPSELVFMLAFAILLPWLVIKTMGFRHRNSAYRNVRFGFQSDYRDAARIFIGMPILTGLTLGLAYPYFVFHKAKFLASNSRYGTSPFEFHATAKEFYGVYTKASLFFLLAMALTVSALFVGGAVAGPGKPLPPNPLAVGASMLFPFLIMPLLFMFIGAYIQAATGNLIWNNVSSKGHHFQCTLRAGRIFMLYLTNAIGIALSLGLLVPWAKIRMARYRADNLVLMVAGDLDGYVAAQQQSGGASGEGITDVFDIDIGL